MICLRFCRSCGIITHAVYESFGILPSKAHLQFSGEKSILKEVVEAILAAEKEAERVRALGAQDAFAIGVAAQKQAEAYAESVQVATRESLKAILAQGLKDGETAAVAEAKATSAAAYSDADAYAKAVAFVLARFKETN